MTESALDQLLESISCGQPIDDLYKRVTMDQIAKIKNDVDFEYLEKLSKADLNTEKV